MCDQGNSYGYHGSLTRSCCNKISINIVQPQKQEESLADNKSNLCPPKFFFFAGGAHFSKRKPAKKLMYKRLFKVPFLSHFVLCASSHIVVVVAVCFSGRKREQLFAPGSLFWQLLCSLNGVTVRQKPAE